MVHLPNLITDLALILASAAVVTLLFKKLKQPLVLGYILAGFLVGPYFPLFPTITDVQSITIWAEIGVIFLLFSLGLEFSFKKLLKVGGASSITAVIEVIVMFAIGYFTGKLLDWSSMNCFFLGGILSISSTTIIIRAFDELGLKSQKFAQLVFGVLIIEDLVAIILLVLLSTLAISQQVEGTEIIISLGKLGFFLSLWFLGGIFLVPTLLRSVRKLMNEETMLITSLAMCLLMVFLAVQAGFSAALGAFIMGSILAETVYAEKIEHLIKSVKDLFAAVFFVSVGMLISPVMLQDYWLPILLITAVTIIGKIFSTTGGAIIAGQPLKNSIKAGMSLSQIGEFSFIIATLGMTYKVTDEFLYPIAIAVSAITTFTTPYLIKSSDAVYKFIDNILPPKMKRYLNRYTAGTSTIKTESDWKNLLKAYVLAIVINGVIISSILILTTRFLYPFIQEKFDSEIVESLVTAVISLTLMSPFLWALAGKKIKSIAYYNLWLNTKYNKGPLIMLELLRVLIAMVLIFLLLNKLFPEAVAVISAFILTLALSLIFSKKIREFYIRLEKRFIQNLNERQDGKSQNNQVAELLPWDAHIAEFSVQPESPLTGKTLYDLKLREDYGVNIATIERGRFKINIPSRDERLYPGDVISVIGTDEGLEKFRNTFIITNIDISEDEALKDVTLHQITIGPGSRLKGKSILESGIHHKLRGLVIGIERGGNRILNPDSSEKFENGDMVWIAAEENILSKLGN